MLSRLRFRLQKWFFPALFSGVPQPHEDRSLRDGGLIVGARQQGLVGVGPMQILRDGDRIALRSPSQTVWIDWRAAQAIGQLGRDIAAEKLAEPETATG